MRHRRRIKKVIPGYDWRPQGARQSPRLRPASPNGDSVMLVATPDTWQPRVSDIHVDIHDRIVACVVWQSEHLEKSEHVPHYYMRLNTRYGPHTVVWPPTTKSKDTKREELQPDEADPIDDHTWSTGSLWLAPPPSAVFQVVDLTIGHQAAATVVLPLWEHAQRYGRALSRSFEYEVLPSASLGLRTDPSPAWAMVAFRFERTFPGKWRATV